MCFVIFDCRNMKLPITYISSLLNFFKQNVFLCVTYFRDIFIYTFSSLHYYYFFWLTPLYDTFCDIFCYTFDHAPLCDTFLWHIPLHIFTTYFFGIAHLCDTIVWHILLHIFVIFFSPRSRTSFLYIIVRYTNKIKIIKNADEK